MRYQVDGIVTISPKGKPIIKGSIEIDAVEALKQLKGSSVVIMLEVVDKPSYIKPYGK